MADNNINFPSGVSNKTPVDNDYLLLSDSEDSYNFKKTTKANLLSGVTSDINAVEGAINNMNINAAWVDYTPSVAAGSGTASNVSIGIARYKKVGTLVFVTGRLSFNKNTLSGQIYLTLPVLENSFLGSISGWIGENAGLSLNEGRTQLENTGRLYFEKDFGTGYVSANDLSGGTIRIRRTGCYEAA